ncbi:Hypothetical predicted protein, partial [Marmota monax]
AIHLRPCKSFSQRVCDTCNACNEVDYVARCKLSKPLFTGVIAKPRWLFIDSW